ncbi:MAG: carbohydrate kinase family protein, partial [Candidatus Helarchaeota archaeon]|nr:carbohydrate kinase family protein [Candidatus Helarchaeota archaeon]
MHDLKSLDILLVDEIEALGLTNTDNVDEAANILLDEGIKILAIKLGPKGCLVQTEDERIEKAAIPIDNMVDSIGAGDAFDSGFITGYLENLSLEKTTKLALKVAFHSLMGVGGSSTIPSRKAIKLE